MIGREIGGISIMHLEAGRWIYNISTYPLNSVKFSSDGKLFVILNKETYI
jgi:hypothetical protein